jgi:hypothetical protein
VVAPGTNPPRGRIGKRGPSRGPLGNEGCVINGFNYRAKICATIEQSREHALSLDERRLPQITVRALPRFGQAGGMVSMCHLCAAVAIPTTCERSEL